MYTFCIGHRGLLRTSQILAQSSIHQSQRKITALTILNDMKYPYDHPGIYAIHIAGKVESGWADYLGGLKVTYEESPTGEFISVLKGPLPDQAALLGILTTLYNARFPLLFVRYLRSQ